jgi:DNA-binding response OmpR family regulator
MANILVIDDEPLLLNLIAQRLELDGHRVTAFENPLAIFEPSPENRQPFDLLLVDVDMRPINGQEVVRRLCQQGFKGSVLYMSGYSNGQELPLIEKPFTVAQLREAVSAALSRVSRETPVY